MFSRQRSKDKRMIEAAIESHLGGWTAVAAKIQLQASKFAMVVSCRV